MREYIKFLKLVFVLSVGVFFLVGCSPTDDKVTDSPPTDPITIESEQNASISIESIEALKENNETIISKEILLKDKKTKVKLSFDLLENNITKDVDFDVQKLDYKDSDGITAKILKLQSSVPLKNVQIEIVDDEGSQNKSLRKTTQKTTQKIQRKVIEASMGEAPIHKVYQSNFYTFIKSTKLNNLGGTYQFNISSTKHLDKVYCEEKSILESKDNEIIYGDLGIKEAFPLSSKVYSKNLSQIDKIYELQCGKIVKYPTSTGGTILDYTAFSTYKMVTDFIGINKNYTVAEKTLKNTRANTTDILNNLLDSPENNNIVTTSPILLDDTVTHRITDFDKLLKGKSSVLPALWKSSAYGASPKGDNGRMPLRNSKQTKPIIC